MRIIDGKKISNEVLDEIKNHVKDRVNNRKKVPHLAAVLIGDDGPSQTYVNSKIRACEKVGFNSSLFKFNDNISEEELISEITKINENKEIDFKIKKITGDIISAKLDVRLDTPEELQYWKNGGILPMAWREEVKNNG